MAKIPVIEKNECNDCEGCIDSFPNIFHYNDTLGFIEVVEQDKYNAEDVDEAIKNCPTNAISWED